MGHIAKAPVNHAITIKVLILLVTHLAQSKMIAIGIDSFKASSVVRALNQGRYRDAANHFMDWVTPSVLVPRRHKEKTLFLQDI